MDKTKAKQMLETAREYVGDDVFKPKNFEDVGLEEFLEQYLWVIYVSGFRNAVVRKHIGGLRAGFHGLDLDRIVAMMGSMRERCRYATKGRRTRF